MEYTFFCCQGYLKDFLENYGFCKKSGSDVYSRRWGNGGHVICFIMTNRVRKSICSSSLIS